MIILYELVFLLGFFSKGADIYSSIFAGLIIAIAFPIGALFAIFINYPSRVKADIAAFGAGTFFAAIAFSLVDESVKEGNVLTMVIGFVVGAIVFSILNHYLKKMSSGQSKSDSENNDDNNNNHNNNNFHTSYNQEYKKQEEKEEKDNQKLQNEAHNEDEQQGTGETTGTGTSAKIVIVGLLLDSIPEALYVGILVALAHGGVVGAVSTLFLGNLTTTMEGAKRMSETGMSVSKIMLRWSFVLLVVALSAPLGFYIVKPLTNDQISIILGFAAGILIAFITEELIPEAYKKANFHIGLSATFGFLLGYILFRFL